MRIQLLSDLHLELHPEFMPQAASNVDILVLAGDIGSYQAGSKLVEDDFGLARFSPLRTNSPWPRVLFTPGNHEIKITAASCGVFRIQNSPSCLVECSC
jgi:predicted phosphodiesterase